MPLEEFQKLFLPRLSEDQAAERERLLEIVHARCFAGQRQHR
jgi:hypothetical protein